MKNYKMSAKTRFDIILIVSLVLCSAAVFAVMLILREGGEYVEVQLDGETVGEYSLALDGEYSIRDGSNILVIENGEAYMSYADCPDKVCVNTGKIRYVGQTVICLPNRVTLTVRGRSSDVDLIS